MFHHFDDVARLALSPAVLQPSHLSGPQRVDRPSRCAGSSIPAGSWAVRLVLSVLRPVLQKKCETLKLRPRFWAFKGQTPFPTPSTCSSNLHPTAENCKGTEKERHELKVSEHLEQFQHQYLSVLNSLANFLITVSPALQIYQRIPLWLLDLFFSCSIHFTCFILGLRDRIIIYNINIDAFTLTPTSSHHCYGAACK